MYRWLFYIFCFHICEALPFFLYFQCIYFWLVTVSICDPPPPSSVPIQVDFLALEMRKGKVSFLWDVGSGVGRVEYPHLSISDGKWHRIEASRWDDHTHTHQHVRTHTHAHTDACSPARTRTHTLWPYETWNWIEKLLKLWKSHKISMEWLSNRILYTGQ